jgi:PAS domain S-box-containing protein
MTKIQQNTPNSLKLLFPIFGIWFLLTLTTLVHLPCYILAGITLIITILAYIFISYIIEKEKYIIVEHQKQLNSFNELFVNLSEENKKLSGELEDQFKDFDRYVISSKTDLFGRITYASTALCKISGFSKEEMLGKPHNIIRHPDMTKEAFRDMWDTIEKNEIWAGEVKNLKKDGGFYWVNAIISPIHDSDGNKIGYNSIRQDITKEKIKNN